MWWFWLACKVSRGTGIAKVLADEPSSILSVIVHVQLLGFVLKYRHVRELFVRHRHINTVDGLVGARSGRDMSGLHLVLLPTFH